MTFIELFFAAVGLSMDAFTVSICKGMAVRTGTFKSAVTVGIWFGIFQAGMPLAGYFIGTQFTGIVSRVSHWIAFILLVIIGVNMLRESFDTEHRHGNSCDALDIKTMFILSTATSIDALAMGVTFALLHVSIFPAAALIGSVTFVVSAFGLKVGSSFGAYLKNKAEIAGGIILILLGAKILLHNMLV